MLHVNEIERRHGFAESRATLRIVTSALLAVIAVHSLLGSVAAQEPERPVGDSVQDVPIPGTGSQENGDTVSSVDSPETAGETEAAEVFEISLEGGEPISSAECLEALRLRDAQFENVTVTVEKSWVEKVYPATLIASSRRNAMRFGLNPDQHGIQYEGEVPHDYAQPHRVRYDMTIRGPEVTVEGGVDLETILHPQFSTVPAKGLRWGNYGGLQKAYHESGNPTLHVQHTAGPGSALEFLRDQIEYSCGYGFSRDMLGLDECVQRDGLKICRGRIRYGHDDTQECRLEIDDNWIVRRAEILLVGNDKSTSKVAVATTGTVHLEELPPVAEQGTVTREITSAPRQDRPARTHVTVDDAFRFVEIKTGLSDGEYRKIAVIEPGPDTLVIDDAKPAASAPVQPPPERSPWLRYFLWANAVLLLVLIAWVQFMRSRRGGAGEA